MENIIRMQDINTSSKGYEIKNLGKGCYEISGKSGSKIIEVLDVGYAAKTIRIRHTHHIFDIAFKAPIDDVLDQLGIKMTSDVKSTTIKAPMPGKVIQVLAKEGEEIEKGGAILILEAMKMENVLKAENNCTIKKVLVSKEENVEKNQVLVEFN